MEQTQDTHNLVKGSQQHRTVKHLVAPRFALPSSSEEENEKTFLFRPAFSLPDQIQETSEDAILTPYRLRFPSGQLSESEEEDLQSVKTDATAPSNVSFLPVPAPTLVEVKPAPLSSQAAQPVTVERQEQEQPASQSTSPVRRKKQWRRVPELRQMSAVEGGAGCLAMILNYYGRATSVSEVQERCGVGRDGLSALAIVKAARQYGLRVRAVSLKKNDARFVHFPAIVHWEFNHFVVVDRWSSKQVDIVDPAVGRRRLTLEEFDEGFTGIVVMLEPGTQFERQAPSRAPSLWAYLRSLPHMYRVMAQIIGVSLLLQIFGLGTPLLTEIVVDYIIPTQASNLLLLMGTGML